MVVLKTKIRGPYSMSVGCEPASYGCKVYNVVLSTISKVESISFRNKYAATVCVKVKRKCGADAGDAAWESSIHLKAVMPSPHLEEGSQDVVTLTPDQSRVDWDDMQALLLIIRQPSCVWKSFQIEDIVVNGKPTQGCSGHFLRRLDSDSEEDEECQQQGKNVSECLMGMRCKVEMAAKMQSDTATGNFEVGPSYEIHQLL